MYPEHRQSFGTPQPSRSSTQGAGGGEGGGGGLGIGGGDEGGVGGGGGTSRTHSTCLDSKEPAVPEAEGQLALSV